MASIFSHLYLGDRDADPSPIFRDMTEEGTELDDGTIMSWPAGATFAVQFTAGRFPSAHMLTRVPELVTFFGADGWPLDFPPDCGATLSIDLKHELQIEPHAWQEWGATAWKTAHDDPEWFSRVREQSATTHSLLSHLSAFT